MISDAAYPLTYSLARDAANILIAQACRQLDGSLFPGSAHRRGLFIIDESRAFDRCKVGASAQGLEFDHKGASHYLAAELLNEADSGVCGAAGRQQIIDDENSPLT